MIGPPSKPVFNSSSEAKIQLGTYFAIECSVSSNTNVSVSWLSPSGVVARRAEITRGSVLHIDSAKYGNTGTYTCMARNSFGTTFKRLRLTVLGEYHLLEILAKRVTSISW